MTAKARESVVYAIPITVLSLLLNFSGYELLA
jgi:hypothetical protein